MRRAGIGWLALVLLLLSTGCNDPLPTPTLVPALPFTSTPVPETSTTVPTSPPIATTTPIATATAPPTSTETELPPLIPSTETPTPYPVVIHIHSMSFADTQHGWVLARACDRFSVHCYPKMRATTDGGVTWQEVVPPEAGVPWGQGPPQSRTISSLYFANAKEGWAFGPSLFVTRDGGQTWTDTSLEGAVALLDVKEDRAWALQWICREGESCAWALMLSEDMGRTWQFAPAQPLTQDDRLQLVRPNTQDAWLLTSILSVTHDGGKTWRELPTPPCVYKSPFVGFPDGQLWLLCGGQGATAMEFKKFYVSPDGGNTWKLVADASLEGLQNLPMIGHVAAMAAASTKSGWIILNRASLFGTHDGGLTWEWAIPGYDVSPGDTPYGPVVVVDENHVWLAAQHRVFRTTDSGTTWDEVKAFPYSVLPPP